MGEHREFALAKVAIILDHIHFGRHKSSQDNHLVVGAQGFELGINGIATLGNIGLYGWLDGTYDHGVE